MKTEKLEKLKRHLRKIISTVEAPNTDLECPAGLDADGKKAWEVIVKLLIDLEQTKTGGCKAFHTPKEWAKREEYGEDSVLIVCHDGGDLSYVFNVDKGGASLFDKMTKVLNKSGFYPEPCTSWYTAIYGNPVLPRKRKFKGKFSS